MQGKAPNHWRKGKEAGERERKKCRKGNAGMGKERRRYDRRDEGQWRYPQQDAAYGEIETREGPYEQEPEAGEPPQAETIRAGKKYGQGD